MRSVLVSLLVISPAFANGQDAPASAKQASDEQAILRLHDEWFKAFDAGDAKTMDRIERDDFTVAGDFGQRTKQQHLENVRRHPQPEKAEEVNRKIDSRQFRFHGDIALITQTDHYPSKAGGTDDFQTTQVWVRSGGSWKVTHLHYTRLAKKP